MVAARAAVTVTSWVDWTGLTLVDLVVGLSVAWMECYLVAPTARMRAVH